MQGYNPAGTLPRMSSRIRISVARTLANAFLSRGMAPLSMRFAHLVVELVPDSHGLNPAGRDPEIALRTARPPGGEWLARRLVPASSPEMWLLVRPEVARLARVRAVTDHLTELFEERLSGSEAA
jgi:DNA-binding transcriptional LysR family regulator